MFTFLTVPAFSSLIHGPDESLGTGTSPLVCRDAAISLASSRKRIETTSRQTGNFAASGTLALTAITFALIINFLATDFYMALIQHGAHPFIRVWIGRG